MTTPGTEDWRAQRAEELLKFGSRAVTPSGRFGWLNEDGSIDRGQRRPLYNSARMTYVWTLASLAMRDTAVREVAAAGLGALADFADAVNGGWHTELDPNLRVSNGHKRNYDHAHVLLAAASATAAGLPGAGQALEHACEVITARFWDDEQGAAYESWDATFTSTEAYRGANSNMHSVEAYLAAGDVTGDATWHARALSIAELLVDRHARANGWRVPEHFTANWTPWPDYNKATPDDRFRPYGTTPGHSFEWARLLLTLEASLGDAPRWLSEAAVHLFDAAVTDGWGSDGSPGFIYTIDENGDPVVTTRHHWVICEAVLAAHALQRRFESIADPESLSGCAGIGQQVARYRDLAARWWQHLAEHFLDLTNGGWWHELGPDLQPRRGVWTGKPDIYHSYQALLFPSLPTAPCAAMTLMRDSDRRHADN